MINVVYKPYRTHIWFVPFLSCISVVFFVVPLWNILSYGYEDLFTLTLLLIVGLASALLAVWLYRTAKKKIIFDHTGLKICSGSRSVKRDYYVAWGDIKYRYLSKSYKGHSFWVLSPTKLNEKQVKKYVNKSANTSRVCFRNVVVLFVDPIQDTSRVEEIIRKTSAGDGSVC